MEDYAIIGNCGAALVGRDGSIDWLALPRFDSAACFATLLGDSENGRWKIAPNADAQITRRYREGTLILETRFATPEGAVTWSTAWIGGTAAPTSFGSSGASGAVFNWEWNW